MSVIDIIQNAVMGIATGATYGLIGLGVVFLWQSISRVNFANISSCMIAVYLFYAISSNGTSHYVISMILAFILTGVYGLILRFFVYEPITKKGGGGLEFVVATLMVSVFWLCAVSAIFGGLGKQFPPDLADPSHLTQFGPIKIPTIHVRIIVVVLFLIFLLHFFLRKTFIGKMIRATAQNKEAAQLMGININLTTSIAFMLSTTLVGIAGMLLAPIFFISLDLGGGSMGIKGFAAAVMGGLIDPYGAIIGGICIGLIENFSVLLISSVYKDVISFVILILVMFWKPRGIFNWTSKGD